MNNDRALIAGAILQRSIKLGQRLARASKATVLKQTSAEVHQRKLNKVERDIVEALARTLRYQISSILFALQKVDHLEGSPEQLLDSIFNPEDWHDEIIDEVLPALGRAMGETAVAFVLLMGVDLRRRRKPPRKRSTASEWLADNGIDLPPGISTELPDWMKDEIASTLQTTFRQPYWKKISRTTRADVLATLTDGVNNGESIRKISQRISAAHGDEYTLARARMVARTEAGNALNGARDMCLKRLKQELGDAGKTIGKSWLSILSDTTRDSHANLDGVLADADGMWSLGGVRVPWPGHYSLPAKERINCFSGDVHVSGFFTKAMRAWYEGRFIEIVMSSGTRVTVTPNHPVMTENGWIAASMLNPGQQVLSYSLNCDGRSLRTLHKEQYKPIAIKDLFETLRAVSAFVEVKRVEMDYFDGDAIYMQGDIDVVNVDRELTLDLISRSDEEVREFFFALAESNSESFGLSDSSLSFGSSAVCTAATGIPSFVERCVNTLRCFQVSPSGSLAIGQTADLDPFFFETTNQKRSIKTRLLRDTKKRDTGLVLFDEIVQIRNFFSRAHVYDLESEGGWILASHHSTSDFGIVASNCYCTIQTELGANAPTAEQIEDVLNPPIAPQPISEALPADEPDPRDPKTWANWSLFEKLDKIPQLQEVQQAVAEHKELRHITHDVAFLEEHRSVLRKGIEEQRTLLSHYSDSLAKGVINDEQYKELAGGARKRMDEKWDVLHDVTEKIVQKRQQVHKELEAVMGIPKKDRGRISFVWADAHSTAKDLQGEVREAATFLQTHCSKDVLDRCKNFKIHEYDPGHRPFYKDRSLHLSRSEKASLVVHEFAHGIEQTTPNGIDHSLRFLQTRIDRAGTPNVSMVRYSPGYGKDEVGNEDGFRKLFEQAQIKDAKNYAAYTGKVYDFPKGSGLYYASEAVSMGMQLMHEKPVHFAQNDPEFFKFIVGFMRGYL